MTECLYTDAAVSDRTGVLTTSVWCSDRGLRSAQLTYKHWSYFAGWFDNGSIIYRWLHVFKFLYNFFPMLYLWFEIISWSSDKSSSTKRYKYSMFIGLRWRNSHPDGFDSIPAEIWVIGGVIDRWKLFLSSTESYFPGGHGQSLERGYVRQLC